MNSSKKPHPSPILFANLAGCLSTASALFMPSFAAINVGCILTQASAAANLANPAAIINFDHKGTVKLIAIAVDPQPAKEYVDRGITKAKAGDNQGAINDYNKAISINPSYARAYANLGVAKAKLGDKQGAIVYLTKASKLFQQQNQIDSYNWTVKAIDFIKKMK